MTSSKSLGPTVRRSGIKCVIINFILTPRRKYKAYTDTDIICNAKTVKSMAGLLRSLNLSITGGNYTNIRRHLLNLGVDTSHWTKELWSKGRQLKPLSAYRLPKNAKYHLIKMRGHKCEGCMNEHWNALPIPLELHHIDGDNTNNDPSNWLLLCPNCHAQTGNYRNRKQALVEFGPPGQIRTDMP